MLRLVALASVLLAALLLFLLAYFGKVDLADLADAWARLPLADYLAALLIHATVYNVRTIRYRLLLPGEHRPAYASVLASTEQPISAASSANALDEGSCRSSC